MYKLAVFDIDGTLIDTERTGVESLMITVRELLGREIPYEDAYRAFGIPSIKVADLYGYPDAVEFGDRWEEHFIALSHHIAPFPGALGALQRVKAGGIATGVVTSRSRFEFDYDDYLRKMLPYLDHIVCAEDTPHHKPHPEPMFRCIALASEALGTPVCPGDVIFFGDTDHDYACAHNAGCDFALADWKGRGWQGIPAQYKFTDAAGIPDILEGKVARA
ncbi:MAG: HAD hydrolase-like protein [Bacteroidales bacterium]|nr:HAD hydrolase-like protein [Bacteroidales bacterium]